MNEKKRKDSTLIQKLVEDEMEAAFRLKPEHELRARLEERLTGEGKQRRFRFTSRKLVPVLTGIFVVFCGVLIGLFVTGKKSHPPPNENLIARFLEKTPGIQTLSKWEELNRLRLEAERFSIPPLPKNLISVLGQLEKDVAVKKSEIQIPDLNQYPALDYRQVLEILFRKKAVHRILMQFSKNFEEEKNG